MTSTQQSRPARRWRISDHVHHAALSWRFFRGRLTDLDARVIRKLAEHALGDYPLLTVSEDVFLMSMASRYELDLASFEIARNAFQRTVNGRYADHAEIQKFYDVAEGFFAAWCEQVGIDLVAKGVPEDEAEPMNAADQEVADKKVIGIEVAALDRRSRQVRQAGPGRPADKSVEADMPPAAARGA